MYNSRILELNTRKWEKNYSLNKILAEKKKKIKKRKN